MKIGGILFFVIAVLFFIGYKVFRPENVRILEEFEFSNGDWKLTKGYSGDSVQYVITDRAELEKIKDEWVLTATDRNFATTGGYNILLYKDGERVLFMDLIIDTEQDYFKPGILYHSGIGTLAYPNLLWLKKGHWKREVKRNGSYK